MGRSGGGGVFNAAQFVQFFLIAYERNEAVQNFTVYRMRYVGDPSERLCSKYTFLCFMCL